MHVPIHDEHLVDALLRLHPADGDGHVVEQAEAHGAARRGVVARRAREGESSGHRPIQDCLGRRDGAACGGERRLPGGGRRRRVGVQPDEGTAAPRLLGSFPDPCHVLRRVDAQEVFLGGQFPELLQEHVPELLVLAHRLEKRREPLLALGMARAGVVAVASGVGDEGGWRRHGRIRR
jgi:hypothetical protein